MTKDNSKKPAAKKKLGLKAEKRKLFGRKIKKLRQQGILPANLYGKKIKSQALKINLKDFLQVFNEAGETSIVELTVDKEIKPNPVLIHNLQFDPVSDEPLHVDFYRVDLTQKVQVNIPIELKGEAPGVAKGGVLVQSMDEVEVEALPTDLPDKFEVDISKLEEIGQSVDVKDLIVDKAKVKILADENHLVVKIEEPKKEEEEKPAEEAAVEEVETVEGAEGAEADEAKPSEEKTADKSKQPAKEEKKK